MTTRKPSTTRKVTSPTPTPTIPMPSTQSPAIEAQLEALQAQLEALQAQNGELQKQNNELQSKKTIKRQTTLSKYIWNLEALEFKYLQPKNRSVTNATVTSVVYRFKELWTMLYEFDLTEENIKIANIFNNKFLDEVDHFIPLGRYPDLEAKSVYLITRENEEYMENGKMVVRQKYTEKDKTKVKLEWLSFSVPYIRFAHKYEGKIQINMDLMKYFYKLQELYFDIWG